jgi:hypothetical protein
MKSQKYSLLLVLTIFLLNFLSGCSTSNEKYYNYTNYENFRVKIYPAKEEYKTTEAIYFKLEVQNISRNPDSLKYFSNEFIQRFIIKDSLGNVCGYKNPLIFEYISDWYTHFKPFEVKIFESDILNNYGCARLLEKKYETGLFYFKPGVYTCQFVMGNKINNIIHKSESNIVIFRVTESEIIEPENLEALKLVYRNNLTGGEALRLALANLDAFVTYSLHPRSNLTFRKYGVLKYKGEIKYKDNTLDEFIKYIKEHKNSYYIKSALYITSELAATTIGKQEAINILINLKNEFPNTEIEKNVNEVLKVDYLQSN